VDATEFFQAWPKIGRINKNVVITEKIDGTNAAIGVRELVDGSDPVRSFETGVFCGADGGYYAVRAQSRKRIITPQSDNFGFASWVFDNAATLAGFLGEGLHFGEWWGAGIQRTYGMERKHFSLFNTHRWGEAIVHAPQEIIDLGVDVVPVLGIWGGNDIGRGLRQVVDDLERTGSCASLRAERKPFERPEGVVTYWTATNTLMKYLIENPDQPKSLQEAA